MIQELVDIGAKVHCVIIERGWKEIDTVEDYQKALKEDKNFLEGLNIFKGQVTYKAVADAFGHSFVSSTDAIK